MSDTWKHDQLLRFEEWNKGEEGTLRSSSAMMDINLFPEMNFTFWWRLEGIATAVWIQVG